MLGEELRRYGFRFERRHMTALSRQLHDEAEHYEAVGRIIEHLGGEVPTAPPPSAERWSGFLWESLDRHHLGAIAAWNMSETAATGTLEGIVEAGRRYDLPEVARSYEKIIRDEKFHIGLGRLLLERYAAEPEDLDEVRRAMAGMAAIVVESHVAVDLHAEGGVGRLLEAGIVGMTEPGAEDQVERDGFALGEVDIGQALPAQPLDGARAGAGRLRRLAKRAAELEEALPGELREEACAVA